VTDYTVSRIFKNTMGISYKKYVTRKRVDHAMELLTNSDMGVQEIAEATGFSSCSYFIKIFKGIVGKTPAEFRRKDSRGE